ncbi:unnamed protein product [Cyprideis torosa]|uniref:Uncharacterized protein n=1 Tax=Cyprideis torosa TaxID=163714 RepID=A0A7R8WFE0_9CRUS|nr:unnamed protein product [Cyprideis torosa]CAG0890492.1 unnamed protein product [Cyprideis torosa]
MAKPNSALKKLQKDRSRRLMGRTTQESKRKVGKRQRSKPRRNPPPNARSGVQAGHVAKKRRRNKRMTKKRSKKPKASPAGTDRARVPDNDVGQPRTATRKKLPELLSAHYAALMHRQETGNLRESRDRHVGGVERVEQHSHDEAGADQQAGPSAHQCVRIGGIQYFAMCGLNRYGRIAAILTPVELLRRDKK